MNLQKCRVRSPNAPFEGLIGDQALGNCHKQNAVIIKNVFLSNGDRGVPTNGG